MYVCLVMMNMALLTVFIIWSFLVAGNAVSSELDLPLDVGDWSDTIGHPSLDLDRIHRFQSFQKSIRAPHPEYVLNWAHKWPTIPLDYGGKHPFENRELQSSSSLSSDSYQPIRMTFITDPLETRLNENAVFDARINTIKTTTLPAVESTWSSHLSVVPVAGAIYFNESICFDFFVGQIPMDILLNGVADSDLAIIVSAFDSHQESDGNTHVFCAPGVLASAVLCARDQMDRPVVGFINFCLNTTATSQQRRRVQEAPDGNSGSSHRRTQEVDNQEAEVKVALHEIGHVLGLISHSFPYFRNSTTGEPLTPRPIATQTVTCTSGETRTIPFPSENTVQQGITEKGLIYYDVVTPRVRQVVRNHFNCQSLNGARLENQDSSPSDCTGSHWDERLFYGELMQPTASGLEVLSPLTLALLEDSGWYRVNYGNTSLLSFGLNAGCDFVNGNCIVNDTVPDYGKGYFCDVTTHFNASGKLSDPDYFCDPTHYEWALCFLFDLQDIPEFLLQSLTPSGLPNVRYFSDPNLVSLFSYGDYCPLPVFPVRAICTDSTAAQSLALYEGEQYSATSRCIDAQYSSPRLGRVVNRPGCFEVQCDADTFQVAVNGVVCSYDFQEITINTIYSSQATMICPRLSTLCPDLFCASDCSGRGVCDYSTKPPTCQCFNASDTSPSCGAASTNALPSSPTTPSSTTTAPTPNAPVATPPSSPTLLKPFLSPAESPALKPFLASPASPVLKPSQSPAVSTPTNEPSLHSDGPPRSALAAGGWVSIVAVTVLMLATV